MIESPIGPMVRRLIKEFMAKEEAKEEEGVFLRWKIHNWVEMAENHESWYSYDIDA